MPQKFVQVKGGKKIGKFVTPMTATLSSEPAFDDPAWLFEIKWDGYRAVAELDGENTRLYSRNGLSFNVAYQKVYKELTKLKVSAVIDGEVVVYNESGKPTFQSIQNYSSRKKLPIQFQVFDCLSLDGTDLTRKPLIERKRILKQFIPDSDVIRYCDHIEEHGVALFEQAAKLGLEGIIAKKANSLYYTGKKSKEWLKIKNVNTDDFSIVGWTDPQSSRQYFGALMIAEETKSGLKYRGTVGTGFTSKLLKDIYQMLAPIERTTSPLKEVVKEKGMHWVDPVYQCQVKYTELTEDGHVRHPSFQGLRIDK